MAAGVGGTGSYELATTRRVPLNYLRSVEALDLLPNFLLQYLQVDREGNAIIVTGPDWMCDRVAADLAKLDAPPAEVSLEVVAVEYHSARELARSLQLERFVGDVAASLDTLLGDVRLVWLPGLPPNWDFLLSHLESESTGKLRSRATLRVLNGHIGHIFAGQQRNIIVNQIEEGVTASLLPIDIGTTLRVQPRLGEGDEAVLQITLDMNSLSGTDPTSGLPIVSLRSANTTARVKQGETIAIAGLRLLEQSREVRRIPILGDLPLIGGLFRAPSRSASDTELAVFVTPHIIRGGQTAQRGATAHG